MQLLSRVFCISSRFSSRSPAMLERSLSYPCSRSIGRVAQGKIGGIYQALASAVKTQSVTHSIHDIPERHPCGGFCKTHSTSQARNPQGIFLEKVAIIFGTTPNGPRVNRIHL